MNSPAEEVVAVVKNIMRLPFLPDIFLLLRKRHTFYFGIISAGLDLYFLAKIGLNYKAILLQRLMTVHKD
jgi:hypothetical protein